MPGVPRRAARTAVSEHSSIDLCADCFADPAIAHVGEDATAHVDAWLRVDGATGGSADRGGLGVGGVGASGEQQSAVSALRTASACS